MSSPFKQSLVVSHSVRPWLSVGLNHQAIFVCLSAWITRLQKSLFQRLFITTLLLLLLGFLGHWSLWDREVLTDLHRSRRVVGQPRSIPNTALTFLDITSVWHIVLALLSQGRLYQQALEQASASLTSVSPSQIPLKWFIKSEHRK